ncbi:hypothetical protein [Saccharopolyspora sp. ASAGF58]|uniref:hypothetical protein n=1 Tax=Saccharopolyspora sp. ASAGF58 TaxID=2719023 RepID=UPI001446071C|nr:hypothetical protein [Saccharopolyspora sp. ASAGF58]
MRPVRVTGQIDKLFPLFSGRADLRVVATLCGYQLAVENTTLALLWETCPDCNAAAHVLAEVPMPPAVGAR